jgi:hypothetical protein
MHPPTHDPFEHGDAETLLTFVSRIDLLDRCYCRLEQQVQIVRLLLQHDALKKFNGNYIDPAILVVDATAANDVQEATQEQTRPTDAHHLTELLKG